MFFITTDSYPILWGVPTNIILTPFSELKALAGFSLNQYAPHITIGVINYPL
jgi:hypothetical protein